jgi:tetratricopeptide (TPR) repeat protein
MKLKHLDNRKRNRNDLNLQMPGIRFFYYIIFLICLTFFECACKNSNSQNEALNSVVTTDPAFKDLNDSINRFPGDATLFFRRAIRLTQKNAFELAYSDFQKAWSLQPTLDIALPYVANLEILGKNIERINLLESLNHRYPSNKEVGRLLADAYQAYGRPDLALTTYNKMIAKDSIDPETFYEKAMLLEQLKDTVQAISSLQKAYSYQGVDTYGLELAHLYAEQRNPKALEICDYVLKHDSARILIDPFFIKGIFYANMKQYPKAIIQFDSCIVRDWKTTDAYLEKGRAYFHMENFNKALETFNMAIAVTNTDPDAYYWLGRCFEAQKRKMDAIINYRKAIALDKNFIEAKQRIDILDSGFAHPSR